MADMGNDFDSYVRGIVQSGFTAVGVSLGSYLGLFQTIADFDEPKTSEEIANAAGYKERYVREWLSAMVSGRIIELDSSDTTEKFFLPKDRISILQSQGQYAKAICLIADARHDVLECFKKDGPTGIPYSLEFHDWMHELTLRNTNEGFMNDLLANIPGMEASLENGISVCNVGCGTDIHGRLLAKMFPSSKFYGIDICDDVIEKANTLARDGSLLNVSYHIGDASQLPKDWTSKFDLVTCFEVLHDSAYPDQMLQEIKRVLKLGGVFSMIDVRSHSKLADNLKERRNTSSLFYMISLMHCMPVSLYFPGGMGLGNMWGEEKAVKMMQEAGLVDIKCFRGFRGSNENHYVASSR